MIARHFWTGARIFLAIVNIAGLPLLLDERADFDVLAGLACGAVLFVALYFWLKKHPSAEGRFMMLDAPFWPMAHYPRAYWFTIGCSLSLSSSVALITHINDLQALQFFGGIFFVSIAIVLGVIYSISPRDGKGA